MFKTDSNGKWKKDEKSKGDVWILIEPSEEFENSRIQPPAKTVEQQRREQLKEDLIALGVQVP